MKRFLLLITAAMLSVVASWAHDVVIDGIYYNLDETNKTAEVTYDASGDNSYVGSVSIPESIIYNFEYYSVTSIGDSAFYYCESIKTIELSNSVKHIGWSAFVHCTSLKKVNYLGTVDEWVDIDFEEGDLYYVYANPTYYAKDLYINGELLTDVKITSADSIKNYAFYNCKSIKSVEIPNSVKSIGRYAFYPCDNISKVNYLGSVDEWVGIDLDSDLLYYAEDLYINDELLTDVVITSADSIKDYAFFNCQSIKTVELGSSVKYIGSYSFAHCGGMESLSIGDNVSSIGYAEAFRGCLNLKNITAYPKVVPKLETESGGDFYPEYAFGTYIAYLNVPCESLEAYELDNVFGQFKYIRCIEEEEEAPEDVEIEVDDNGNVNIKWPPTEGANSYKLVVSHAGNVICTLQFNSMGQLTSIDLGTRSASVGFEFTVTGLTQNSRYAYEMTALDANEEVLEYYAGAFITNSNAEEGDADDDVTTSIEEALSDIAISASNGLITCSDSDFTIYNTIGQNVTAQNGSLTPGVYVVQVVDDFVKVMMK